MATRRARAVAASGSASRTSDDSATARRFSFSGLRNMGTVAYVGIDVAVADGKRLPASVCTT